MAPLEEGAGVKWGNASLGLRPGGLLGRLVLAGPSLYIAECLLYPRLSSL